jgi:hypothetical protein
MVAAGFNPEQTQCCTCKGTTLYLLVAVCKVHDAVHVSELSKLRTKSRLSRSG